MSGIYIHFPYCLQKCPYCDFMTITGNEKKDKKEYVDLVKLEIQKRSHLIPFKKLTSIYFGGGTPSLMEDGQIKDVLDSLKEQGFLWDENTEINLEINPGTIYESELKSLLDIGVNRFSVGVQTFNDKLLKMCKREHSAKDSLDLLGLFDKHKINYSMDLLFGLPYQSLEDVKKDLKELDHFDIPHVSTYLLTLPKNHYFSKGRALDEVQVEMFKAIKEKLEQKSLIQYEVSNFGKENYFSKHNQIYWNLKSYWGLGASAHSFICDEKTKLRFWNSSSLNAYKDQIHSDVEAKYISDLLPHKQKEDLKEHEFLTDFCHTSLRQVQKGLVKQNLEKLFPLYFLKVIKRLKELERQNFLEFNGKKWSLSWEGICLSNIVFSSLTFLEEDLKN